jgi:hypothetical protein
VLVVGWGTTVVFVGRANARRSAEVEGLETADTDAVPA